MITQKYDKKSAGTEPAGITKVNIENAAQKPYRKKVRKKVSMHNLRCETKQQLQKQIHVLHIYDT